MDILDYETLTEEEIDELASTGYEGYLPVLFGSDDARNDRLDGVFDAYKRGKLKPFEFNESI